MAIFLLDKLVLAFPNPRYGEPDGLLAVGGDLSVERLRIAYSNGIFPWYSFRRSPEIMWFCPLNRFVIFPAKIHVSHSMRTLINKRTYRVSFDTAFDDVIAYCSRVDGRYEERGAWLGEDIIAAYKRLHEQHLAASVEVWKDTELVGGLYGVMMGRGFFGESMFSLQPSASKLALIYLAKLMQRTGGNLIDCQFETPHLKSMGGEHISYDEYMKLIRQE